MCQGVPEFVYPYSIDNSAIATRDSYKDLGVVLSSDLTWNKHHDLIIGGAYRQLGLLRRTFANVRSTAAKKQFFLTLVRLQIMYCSHVYL